MKNLFYTLLLFTISQSIYPVVILPETEYGTNILIAGTIKSGDYDKVLEIIGNIDSLTDFTISAEINSDGGDVEEAIKIGKLFRELYVEVNASGSCNSACFLIWLGGSIRTHYTGNFGLHRPYFDPLYYSNLSAAEADIRYSKLEKAYREYLSEMGAPLDFIDKIMSYKSTDAYYLDGDDVLSIVGIMPAALEEWFISKCGELSKDETEDRKYLSFIRSDERALQKQDSEIGEIRDFLERRLKLHKEITSNLSDGYKKYLLEKLDTIEQCKFNEIAQLQLQAIQKMRNME